MVVEAVAVAVATAAENGAAMAAVAVASVADAPWPLKDKSPQKRALFFRLRPSQSRTNKVTRGSGPSWRLQ